MNPNSRLWLCKTNLENDYKNTLTFSSKNAQRNYFIGDPSDPADFGVSTKSYSEYTYLRIEQAIKVDDLIDNIDTNNYLVLINNNKYYYYFITSMDYIDEETTKIHIELDVMQTYFFDIEYKQTFIEREHVTDDTAGKHTIPEGLDTGDYIGSDEVEIEESTSSRKSNIIAQVIYEDSFGTTNSEYGGVFSGTLYLSLTAANAIKLIKYYDSLSQKDYIINFFMYYGNIESSGSYYIDTQDYGHIDYKLVNSSSTADTQDLIVFDSKPTTVGYYTPRNKKLLTYPYCYMLANNHSGSTKVYKYEDFDSTNIKFVRKSTVCVGGSVTYYPWSYKQGRDYSQVINYAEGFVGAKFPTCSWTSDGYTNWLTQNAINESYEDRRNVGSLLFGVGTTALGALTLNPVIAGAGGAMILNSGSAIVNDVVEDMQAKQEHSLSPLELQGFSNAGDVIYAQFRCVPSITKMFIKEEYAKIIDKFFDQFGYKVNILKTPNIHTRSNWNFLKTKNCNFTGDIPQEYMNRIKSIFDKGITFWHKPQYMLDYTQTNSVIS